GTRKRRRHHRPPARGGLRVSRGHREPPGVHGPLHLPVAPDADGLLRRGRGRALPPRQALPALLLGRHLVRRRAGAVPHPRRRPRGQVQSQQALVGVAARPGVGRGDQGLLPCRERGRPGQRPPGRGLPLPRMVQAQRAQGARAPPAHPRGGQGPGPARHGGRPLRSGRRLRAL
ncbi:MAG: hypothetical protein AVDCRST_MAG38-361, partial [uncultured Solirubrobacteraceae bacterium]